MSQISESVYEEVKIETGIKIGRIFLWLDDGDTQSIVFDFCLALSVFLCLFPLSFASRDSALSTNEKSGRAAERLGRDGQDKRWTLPFSYPVFVWLRVCVSYEPKHRVQAVKW